jgi:hypothetical protein
MSTLSCRDVAFGEGGSFLIEAAEGMVISPVRYNIVGLTDGTTTNGWRSIVGYNYDRMHEILVQTMSWDGLACEPNTAVPLLLHWGNVREAHTCLDKTLSNVAMILKQDGPVTQETLTAACTLPTFLLTLGRRQEAVELMCKLQIDGERIDRTVQVRLYCYVHLWCYGSADPGCCGTVRL